MLEKKRILKYEIISTIFIILLGALLHFTFKWSSSNPIIGTFSAVNESVWEHLKILFFPMLITTLVGQLYLKKYKPNYLAIKTQGILLALAFIVIFFYTYSGIIGNHYPLVDIISFVIAVLIEEIYTYKKLKTSTIKNNNLAIITLTLLSISFIIFTFYTPQLGIFKDLSTNTYGIK